VSVELRLYLMSHLSLLKSNSQEVYRFWQWQLFKQKTAMKYCACYSSVADTATSNGLDGPELEFRQTLEIFSSPKPSRPARGPTQPHSQRVPGIFHRGKEAGAWSWPNRLVPRLMSGAVRLPHPPYLHLWRGQGQRFTIMCSRHNS
jgi:hypothetical protein